jgi:23S rRNA G2069 N7-methylase RlmK/C1962 C5-methylase RlmI
MSRRERSLEELDPAELQRLSGQLLGKKYGSKGGKARARNLSAKQRSEIARKAAAARWANNKPND